VVLMGGGDARKTRMMGGDDRGVVRREKASG
jgi:hypothetical protein